MGGPHRSSTVPKPRWNEVAREYNLRRDAAVLRGPIEWSWDMTNRCTGRCRHCFNRSGTLEREELGSEKMMDVARQIAELEPLGICLCGGEPMVRTDTTLAIAHLLSTAGVKVNMVSNGQLISPAVAEQIAGAGIEMVQISLDGATAATHEQLRGVCGAFDAAIAAIRSLRSCNLTVGVAFSPTRFNLHEWCDLYELCTELGVYELRVQPLMPLGQAALHFDDIAPHPHQYDELIDAYKANARNLDAPVRIEWGDPVDHLIRFGAHYAMATYTLHITSDGFLTPTTYLPVVVGNVRRHTLSAYWQAGVSRAWQLRLIRELAYRVRSNRGFAEIRPLPFFDAPVDLDPLEHSPDEIERLTDVVLDLVERVSPRSDRPAGPWAWEPDAPSVRRAMSRLFGDTAGLSEETR